MNRSSHFPRAAIAIIACNVLYFLYLTVRGSTLNTEFMLKMGALYAPYVIKEHEYYRLVSSMFMHFGFEHLFSNMLLLYFMGSVLEDSFGSLLFVFTYLISGLAGNVASVIYYSTMSARVVSAGASGAVFGLVGAVAWMIIKNHGYYKRMGMRQILLMVVFSIYSGVIGGGINNTAHIAGLVAGFFCGMVFSWGREERYAR